MTRSEVKAHLTKIALKNAPEYKQYNFHIGETTHIPVWDEQIGFSQMELRNSDSSLVSITLEPYYTFRLKEEGEIKVTF